MFQWISQNDSLINSIFLFLAFLVSAIGLYQTSRSNRENNQNTQKSLATALAAEERQSEQDKRLIAGSLQTWWVIKQDNTGEKWGIVIYNRGQHEALFHNITIHARHNSAPSSIKIATLPPGIFFQWMSKATSFPEPVNLECCQPVMNSTKHSIDSMEFTDQLGIRWHWTPKDGLTQC